MQYPDDLVLDAALNQGTRVLSNKLEFDWLRDGTFSGSPYCDLSELLVSATDDRQTKGDLPEEVNTLEGFSSAELTVTLAGQRDGELPVHKLFSTVLSASPLYVYKIRGVPIRISDIVETPAGPSSVRMFTGWVRSFEVFRKDAKVTLKCSDILDFEGQEVTLPHWSTYDHDGLEGVSTTRPISATWAVEEILRQGGRPTGPEAHPNCVTYWTCNGSFLPSVGSMAIGNITQRDYWPHHGVQFNSSPPFAQGKYGLAPVKNTGMVYPDEIQSPVSTLAPEMRTMNFGLCSANRRVLVPENGTGNPSVTIGMAAWVYSDGTGFGFLDTNEPYARISMGLDRCLNYKYVSAGTITNVTQNPARPFDTESYGSVGVNFFKHGGVEISVATTITALKWEWHRNVAQPIGWHYYDIRVQFTNSSISLTSLRIDDVVQTTTTIADAGQGYVFFQGVPDTVTNVCYIGGDLPIQHAQIYAQPTTSMPAYVAGQGEPPTKEGRPLAVVHGGTLHELEWMPEVYKANPWQALADVASGGFDVVHTDEYGTIHYVPHYIMRTYSIEDLPAAVYITDDQLTDTVLTPTEDQYRNVISLAYTSRKTELVEAWKQPDVSATWFIQPGQVVTTTHPMEDVIGINVVPDAAVMDIHSGTSVALSGPPDFYASDWATYGRATPITHSAAIQQSNWSLDSTNATFGTLLYPNLDQRYISFFRFLNSSGLGGVPLIFSWYGGDKPAVSAGGRKYSEKLEYRIERSNSTEITENGRRTLRLDANDWLQGIPSANAVGDNLLKDTIELAPIIRDLELPADPRRQLRDMIVLVPDDGISEELFCQIIGINRTRAGDGNKDKLTLRIVFTPNEALWSTEGVGWDDGTWAA